jgi:TPR repeat protein
MKSITITLLLLLSMHAKADIATGIRAYNAGDYETAKTEFETAAAASDPQGIHLLASLYYTGHGVQKDVARSITLFKEAATKGYRASQANLGLMYHSGDGVERNVEKAIEYYSAASRQGDLQSTFNLGQIYRKGDGIKIDFPESFCLL